MVWVGDEEDSDEEKPFSKEANYDQLEPLQTSQMPVWNPGCCHHAPFIFIENILMIHKFIETSF